MELMFYQHNTIFITSCIKVSTLFIMELMFYLTSGSGKMPRYHVSTLFIMELMFYQNINITGQGKNTISFNPFYHGINVLSLGSQSKAVHMVEKFQPFLSWN